jgi:hypothetical protein
MKRIAGLVTVTLLALGSLTACGGGGDDYCGALEDYDADESLRDLDPTSEEGGQEFLGILEDLQSKAPADLEDDYEIVVNSFQAFTEGNVEDVDPDFEGAFSRIGEHAQEECDVDMGT